MTIGYTTIGSGNEKIMVFHGWFGDYKIWEPTFEAIDKKTFTYAFLDYRGYGKSKCLKGDYTMKEIATDANKVANELGWKQFHVVGHSMGGMAMQRLILDCNRTITIRSAFGVSPVPASGLQLDENSWELFKGAITDNGNRHEILNFSTGNRLSATWLNYLVKESRSTTTEAAYKGYLYAFTENFMDEVKHIKTPMMVCVGEHDFAINADLMKATFLTWYPDCKLEIIPNAGHYAMQETPIYLITLIESFTRKYMG